MIYTFLIHITKKAKKAFMAEKRPKSYVITKRIAKHGNQSIIVLPSLLKDELRPKTIVKVTLEIIRGPENE